VREKKKKKKKKKQQKTLPPSTHARTPHPDPTTLTVEQLVVRGHLCVVVGEIQPVADAIRNDGPEGMIGMPHKHNQHPMKGTRRAMSRHGVKEMKMAHTNDEVEV